MIFRKGTQNTHEKDNKISVYGNGNADGIYRIVRSDRGF